MNGHLRDAQEEVRLVKVSAHVYACGVRGEEPEAKGSHRFQPQNLGKAVPDTVAEMCPNPAPATEKACVCGLFRLRAGGRVSVGGGNLWSDLHLRLSARDERW